MFGRCRGGLHADSCQRDAAPVVRKVGVVPGAISAKGQPPTCNIHTVRRVIQPQSLGRLFYLFDPVTGVLLKCAYQGPQRHARAASRALACHRRAAPGTRPVYPTRAPPTPSPRHLLPPPVAKEVGRNWESQQRQHYAPRPNKTRDGDARGHK
jgi:hypothetical protein